MGVAWRRAVRTPKLVMALRQGVGHGGGQLLLMISRSLAGARLSELASRYRRTPRTRTTASNCPNDPAIKVRTLAATDDPDDPVILVLLCVIHLVRYASKTSIAHSLPRQMQVESGNIVFTPPGPRRAYAITGKRKLSVSRDEVENARLREQCSSSKTAGADGVPSRRPRREAA